MVISTTEVQSLMNAEKDRVLPSVTTAIDAWCKENLDTEYKFIVSVDAESEDCGDVVVLDVSEHKELMRSPSKHYWEDGMMTHFISALSEVYNSAGWAVVISGSPLEVQMTMSFVNE